MTSREFDIVLFGATGFVGALTAEHLALHGAGARIALAGRSRAKLSALQKRLPEQAAAWDLIEVDATDGEALTSVAARTSVLVSTVGPYLTYGKAVVMACADQGTHYADLTGEVLFVRWSLDHAAKRAQETGAKIVHACGFDSVPSDLGVLITAEQAESEGSGTLTQTTLAVLAAKGGFSGGTVDSARQQAIAARADAQARKVIGDSYGLSPRRDEEPRGSWRGARSGEDASVGDAHTSPATTSSGGVVQRLAGVVEQAGAAVQRSLSVEQDLESGRWYGPFVMASFNTRIVRLSNTLTDWSYGRGFRYREVTDFGKSAKAPFMAGATALGLGAAIAGLAYAPTRAIIDRLLPKPGEGPSAEAMAAGLFRMRISADTTSGVRYVTAVGAPYDPGYSGTAIMLGQSALCIADVDNQDGLGPTSRVGVLTPATAMGDALVDRLRRFDFTFEVGRATD